MGSERRCHSPENSLSRMGEGKGEGDKARRVSGSVFMLKGARLRGHDNNDSIKTLLTDHET